MVLDPLHTTVNALLERPERFVMQNPLRLGDVIVTCHASHCDLEPSEGGRLAGQVAKRLAQDAEKAGKVLVEVPCALCPRDVASGVEHGAGKVPKVHGGVVGDEEGLAVDLFVVEGRGGGGGGAEEALGGEEVGVGDVADICEVEEVEVVAELDLVLAALVGVVETGNELNVALTKDTGGADGGGEELVGLLSVCF